ncbi:MAG: dipeptidase, partial [Planctomycetes bacterium]|nr:dipeptidase [Planctomycetota bacterium]
RLPEHGILPDVSHMSPRALLDALDAAEGPVLASHSNAHWVCPVTRNLTKREVRAIAATGGVIGVNVCPAFLELRRERATIASVVRHIEAIAEVAGPDHVGLGTDFDGISDTPRGLPHAGAIQAVARALERRRHPRDFIAKAMGGNFLRLFRETWR